MCDRLDGIVENADSFQKIAFLPLYQPADKHVALVNQRDGEVGYHLV